MIIVVGLGNPGKKFEKTRHNVGFRAVEEIAANFQFSPAFLQKSGVQSPKEKLRFPTGQAIFNAQVSKGIIAGKKVILAKPQTFMNESGKAVKKLTHNLQLTTDNLWVIHDDIDLLLGKIRIVKNRGSAGHQGVQSIIDELKTKNFVRFRIGIRPNNKTIKPFSHKTIESFVLQKFNKTEEKILKEVIERTCRAIEMVLKEGLEKTMNEFNK